MMAGKNTIDLTQLEGESHLSEIVDNKTVSGTSNDDNGEEGVDNWPNGLPREVFNDDMANAVKLLVLGHGNGAVADKFGHTTPWVHKVKNRAALFIDPTNRSWLEDDLPKHSLENMPESVVEHEDVRPSLKGNDGNGDGRSEWGDYNEMTREIVGRHKGLGQSAKEIVDAMEISMNKVTGSLYAKNHMPEEAYIMPENASTATGIDAEVLGQEPDLGDCECRVPQLAVDSTSLGPSALQSLYCGTCGEEFTVIRDKEKE